jgi:hypothetical protein
MRDVIVSEGSPAQFRTQVSGKPQPTIQWLRDGLVIPQSADFQVGIHLGMSEPFFFPSFLYVCLSICTYLFIYLFIYLFNVIVGLVFHKVKCDSPMLQTNI